MTFIFSTLSNNLVGKISAHFKNTPVYHILQNVHQCGFLVLKHISYRLLRIGVHFMKHDIQGVFLKCAEILPTGL
jgi:hypothetical protein